MELILKKMKKQNKDRKGQCNIGRCVFNVFHYTPNLLFMGRKTNLVIKVLLCKNNIAVVVLKVRIKSLLIPSAS